MTNRILLIVGLIMLFFFGLVVFELSIIKFIVLALMCAFFFTFGYVAGIIAIKPDDFQEKGDKTEDEKNTMV